jgi:hypothetical protein
MSHSVFPSIYYDEKRPIIDFCAQNISSSCSPTLLRGAITSWGPMAHVSLVARPRAHAQPTSTKYERTKYIHPSLLGFLAQYKAERWNSHGTTKHLFHPIILLRSELSRKTVYLSRPFHTLLIYYAGLSLFYVTLKGLCVVYMLEALFTLLCCYYGPFAL